MQIGNHVARKLLTQHRSIITKIVNKSWTKFWINEMKSHRNFLGSYEIEIKISWLWNAKKLELTSQINNEFMT